MAKYLCAEDLQRTLQTFQSGPVVLCHSCIFSRLYSLLKAQLRSRILYWQLLLLILLETYNPCNRIRLGSDCSAYELICFVDICQPFTLLRFCAQIQIHISFSVGSRCAQQRKKIFSFCGFNHLAVLRTRQISVFVRSHLSNSYFQTSVNLNVHFEGRICKPQFLCVLCRVV